MHTLRMILIAFATVAVVSLTASTSKADSSQCNAVTGNLVLQCGFEELPVAGDFGPSGPWFNTGNTFFSGVAGVGPVPHSGIHGAFFGNGFVLGFLTQNIATVAGAHYNLSFFLSQDPTDAANGPNMFQLSFGGTQLLTLTNSNPFPYTLFTFNDLVATGSTTELMFAFRNDGSHGFFFLDDVVIVRTDSPAAVPEPATMLLLGSGLLGFGVKLRKRRTSRAA
jgi:hypothetical protein